MKKMTLIFLAGIFLNSCGTVPAKIILPLPPEPIYPKINKSALICIGDEDFKQIVIRDVLKSRHIETLQGIIKSTH